MTFRAIPLAALLASGLLCAPAQAQTPSATTAAGPYYATPSWDQKLPSATRFVVLSNWNNEAALDRETGLVWQLGPRVAVYYNRAVSLCLNSTAGGRGGWRLPTIQELMRTAVAGPAAEWISDSPILPAQPTTFWSATPGSALVSNRIILVPGGVSGTAGLTEAPTGGNPLVQLGFRCVQSPAGGDSAGQWAR